MTTKKILLFPSCGLFWKKMILSMAFVIGIISQMSAQKQGRNLSFSVDDKFPGGNVMVDSINGNNIYIHQDLHDTEANWFYWCFSVSNAQNRTLTFHFTHPWKEYPPMNVIGVHGPAVSFDKGLTWSWIGEKSVNNLSFTYNIPSKTDEVRFSVGMPYTEKNLLTFLKRFENHPNLETASLALSRKGRNIERLHIGNITGNPKYRILLTARQHACEMMTNYLLEGVIEYVLSDNAQAEWLRKNVEILIIPFVDKDGVEDGDQGKHRRGRDHNRDYTENSIYPSTLAIKSYLPVWSDGKLVAALDLHCPFLSGKEHEQIHIVGSGLGEMAAATDKFSVILQRISTADKGLPYQVSYNIPFGTSWNTEATFKKGKSLSRWAGTTIEGVKLSVPLEFPFANASGQIITQDNSRGFGRTLAKSLYEYLISLDK